jgi:hypothetical protein
MYMYVKPYFKSGTGKSVHNLQHCLLANGLKVIQWPGESNCCLQEVLCKLPEHYISSFILGNVSYEIEVIQLNLHILESWE